MEAKSADGAFNLSSGALDAAKACADLISRISSVAIGSHSIPGVDEIVEALAETAQDAVTDTAREACQYTASTSTAWVRSQASTLRSTANSQASNLVGARVSVTNPSVRSVLNTYRSRLRGKLPGYSDLPSLKLN
ncbi:MAG: hypothetical protein Q4F72_07525 [Desulfovibrionaceae bacterium]|nr:hypothetical protein [Desulfovibrionaceae bacterium]